MIWFETVTKIDADTEMGSLVVLVTKLHMIALAIGVVIICVGAVFTLTGGIFVWRRKSDPSLSSPMEKLEKQLQGPKSSVPYKKSIY